MPVSELGGPCALAHGRNFSSECEQLTGSGQISRPNRKSFPTLGAVRPLHWRTRVTLKIETAPGKCTTITLIGRIQTEHLSELKTQVDVAGSNVVLDLSEVSLVNLEVVRFLGTCESRGVQLQNCSAYIREWIDREGKTP